MASIEVIKNREIRGCILRALAKTQFRAIRDHSLALALVSVTTDIYPHLCYLADKGYISVVDVRGDDIPGVESLVNLTAKGVDLIEGSIPGDVGIVL